MPGDFEMVRGYLAARGLEQGFIREIHEADEMYAVLPRKMANTPARGMVAYFDTGDMTWRALENALEQAGRSVDSIGRVLECACGYGRFTRFLIRHVDPSRVTAIDIQPRAIDFQAKVMGTNALLSSTDPKAVPVEGPFDLIIVISLFTHLPEHRFHEWLTRLYELLAPDGLLLFTVHPLDVQAVERHDPSGFIFEAQRSEENEIASADPEIDRQEYGSTFASEAAVRRIAGACGVDHLYFSSRGLVAFQDLYVASRIPLPGLEKWKPARTIEGFVDRVERADPGRLRVSGWCMDVSRGEPPRDLEVWIDGKPFRGEALLCQERNDVAEVSGKPSWRDSGWSMTGKAPRSLRDQVLVNVSVDGIHFDTSFFEVQPDL